MLLFVVGLFDDAFQPHGMFSGIVV